MEFTTSYINGVKMQFTYYKLLGERTFDQLESEDLFWQFNEESNSIAIIVKHLWGNMMSRWTDFLKADGEKEWRNREAEFINTFGSKEELLNHWEKGWKCLINALEEIDSQNIESTIYIRNSGHSVVDAINRQLAHYAYHIGQVVYIGRMIKGKHWKSLSIPKGDSQSYNDAKFAQEKRDEHFTKEIIEKLK